MALVSYDSSDSENELTDQEEEIKSNTHQSNHLEKDEDLNDLKTDNLLKLPLPSKNRSTIDKSLNNLTTSKIRDQSKVKIFLPSYKGDDDDDERESKRFKYSSEKGSGLKSLLPPPKNKITKTTSLVPQILKTKPQSTVTKSTSIKPSFNQTFVDDDEPVNFFTFDSDQTIDKQSIDPQVQTIQPNKFETDLINNELSNKPINRSTNLDHSNQASLGGETDYQKERKLKYEIEKRFGDQMGDDVKIQEVNIANHMNDNLDYIKTLSEERDVQVKGPAPTSLAKRKHQITYLAYQAKQNELKLKNEWAQGRINRDQARSKYGF